jgi:hypothetical protein
MDIRARLPNLPVPRELRDQIYGYLLDSSYTRTQRKYDQFTHDHNYTGPKAYHFHTNILAVNRAIREEAEELLYKSNTFAVVSYQWPSLGKERGGLFWAPMVSNKHVARMKYHSLRVHVSPGATGQNRTNASVPIESYIILASDMNAFAATMHARERDPTGACATISTVSGTIPQISVVGVDSDGKAADPAHIRCQLRDTKYRVMNRELQNSMLAPLATVIGKSQKVSFTGPICDSQQTEHLKKRMGPSLACQNAVQWHTFEECEVAKEVADAAVEHDELELVVQFYRIIVSMLSIKFGTLTNSGERAMLMRVSPFAEMLIAIDTFTLEVLLIFACGELKLRNIDRFVDTCNEVERILLHANVSPVKYEVLTSGVMDRRNSGILYRYLYEPHHELHGEPYGTVAEYCDTFFKKGVNLGPLMAHDYEILRRHPDQDALLSAQHLPLNQCAAVCLPFTTSSFYKTVEGAMQKGHYQGWLDESFLRVLPNELLGDIHATQEQFGLAKTDFTRL